MMNKYLTNYFPNANLSANAKSLDRQSARKLTSLLITGIWLIYEGHENPQNPIYLDYKSWFNDENDFQASSSIRSQEIAVKKLLQQFDDDKNFDMYKNSSFFTACQTNSDISLKGYRTSQETNLVINIDEYMKQVTNNGKLRPIEELNFKEANGECENFKNAVLEIKSIAAAASI